MIYFGENEGRTDFVSHRSRYVEGIKLAESFRDVDAGSPIVGLSPALLERYQLPGTSGLLRIHCRESPKTSSPVARTHR